MACKTPASLVSANVHKLLVDSCTWGGPFSSRRFLKLQKQTCDSGKQRGEKKGQQWCLIVWFCTAQLIPLLRDSSYYILRSMNSTEMKKISLHTKHHLVLFSNSLSSTTLPPARWASSVGMWASALNNILSYCHIGWATPEAENGSCCHLSGEVFPASWSFNLILFGFSLALSNLSDCS